MKKAKNSFYFLPVYQTCCYTYGILTSHGGSPHILSLEEFYRGISKPRNIRLMKFFSDLDIVDHTGHGVPIIIEKYGREAFDISDNHIIVTIQFNQEVVNSINVGINVGVSVDENLNEIEIKIICLFLMILL